MTALNVAKWHSEIVVISDGAAYDKDGRLLMIAPKIDLLPHFSGFVFHSGGSSWTPAIASTFSHLANDTDDLFERAAELLEFVESNFAGLSQQPLGRVLFGGWSDSKKQMRLGAVVSEYAAGLEQDGNGAEVIQVNAYEVKEFEGDQLICQPSPGPDAWAAGCPISVHKVEDIRDFELFGSFLLRAQRAIASPDNGTRGVGGFGQIARITKEGCTTCIFERYYDVIGEIMMPQPVADWSKWRAEQIARRMQADIGAPIALSRVRREMAERKAKKQRGAK